MTPARVVLSLVRRPLLGFPRVAIAQFHSSAIIAKSKRPKNSAPNPLPSAPPPPNPVKPAKKDKPIKPETETPSNVSSELPVQPPPPAWPQQPEPSSTPSAATENSSPPAPPAPPSKPPVDEATTVSPPPPPPEDVNPLTSEQYQEFRGRQATGPFTWKALVIFLLTGTGLVIYFRHEKERMERLRLAEENKSVGTPRVGGPYSLVDHNGNKVTQDTYAGKHTLIYFGFTRCPDICPEELDKMAQIIDNVNEKGRRPAMIPLFITCDPARDDPASLKKYLSEFHPDIIGLTGTYDDIKQTCKAFRVYFSTPPNVKPGQDYIVDHSIFFYLMDPENNFVEVYGRNLGAEEISKKIIGHINDWEKFHRK